MAVLIPAHSYDRSNLLKKAPGKYSGKLRLWQTFKQDTEKDS